jgi:hypothetical protein
MKIFVPSQSLIDIGPLDRTLRLPMASRLAHGIKTTCKRCRKPITDEYFIAGFKQGRPNMMFHESCVPPEEMKP